MEAGGGGGVRFGDVGAEGAGTRAASCGENSGGGLGGGGIWGEQGVCNVTAPSQPHAMEKGN